MGHSQSDLIKVFIVKKLPKHSSDIVAITAQHFGVTRTTVHRHLMFLEKENKIFRLGTTRNMKYYLADAKQREITYPFKKNIDESLAWEEFKDFFDHFSGNVKTICDYGFTEIFNNALEHSRGTKVSASVKLEKGDISICIEDDGIGVFKNIADYFDLPDLRDSIVQLNKGKMTTDPSDHTGEGIFFNSRVFDYFEIYANQLRYFRNNLENDWSLQKASEFKKGSRVLMKINCESERQLTHIFKQYQEPDSFEFQRTDITVELAKHWEETLMSRSQAKRIILGLEKFRRVTLDFKKIEFVGQGFVDEVFRVFQNKYPEIEITYVNANEDVEFMIKRGIATARSQK